MSVVRFRLWAPFFGVFSSKSPNAQIAQSVEQGIENPRVGGSIPPLGTIFRFFFKKKPNAQIAQSVEQGIENPRVGGSIPPLGTILKASRKRGFFVLTLSPA